MLNIFKKKQEKINVHLGDCSVDPVESGVNSEVYIFIGRSGCGKGTQVKLIKEALKEKRGNIILHVETGAFLREYIKGDSYVQKLVAKILATGGLVVEPILVALWGDYLMKNYSGKEDMIFDGAPRKLQEAILLDSMLNFLGINKYKVIHINTSSKWATERLLARGRADDTKEGIAKRMHWYDTDVMKSIKFFKKNKNAQFIDVNGEQTIEEVSKELISKVFKN
jgi:adenylate kinase family enzyme